MKSLGKHEILAKHFLNDQLRMTEIFKRTVYVGKDGKFYLKLEGGRKEIQPHIETINGFNVEFQVEFHAKSFKKSWTMEEILENIAKPESPKTA